jgi:hypothetical protein
MVCLVSAAGCSVILRALQDAIQDSDGDGSGANGNGVPAVVLSVTNPTPQLNEQVVLQCSVVGADTRETTFGFQPADGRLWVNQTAGTASLVIEETDVGGPGLAFTCTATNAFGTSEPSNQVVIMPTSP